MLDKRIQKKDIVKTNNRKPPRPQRGAKIPYTIVSEGDDEDSYENENENKKKCNPPPQKKPFWLKTNIHRHDQPAHPKLQHMEDGNSIKHPTLPVSLPETNPQSGHQSEYCPKEKSSVQPRTFPLRPSPLTTHSQQMMMSNRRQVLHAVMNSRTATPRRLGRCRLPCASPGRLSCPIHRRASSNAPLQKVRRCLAQVDRVFIFTNGRHG